MSEQENKNNEFFLIMNAGSSSLKYALYTKTHLLPVFRGHVDGIGLETCFLKIHYQGKELNERFKAKDHVHATLKALHSLQHYGQIKEFSQITAIAHRVVHGGERFTEPTLITDKIIEQIRTLSALAPLHNPPALASILACKKVIKEAKQYAIFDTSFHHSIPKYAFLYGLPIELYEQHGIRKYGFHGISHEYMAMQVSKLIGTKNKAHEIITCHLGNGSSITAIHDGKSIDTSMGFTPLDGLIMGTRSGELDPEILLYLLEKKHYTVQQLSTMLHKNSGLKGLTGDSDVRELYRRSKEKDEAATLALDMLAYRIAKYIGSYAAACKGLDAIAFSGGIGENAFYLRKKACSYLQHLGVEIEAHANRKNEIVISSRESKVKVFVIPANEEKAMVEKLEKLEK